jgi:hypothetical protein
MNNCKNCNEPINGNYCSNCGQPAKLKRIDKQYIIHEIGDILFANRGMLYTIKKMLTNPGENVRRYITEDRSRYVKPITFVIVTSLIYTIINNFFKIKVKDYITQADAIEGTTTIFIMNWALIENPGYASIISVFLTAFCL